MSSGRTIGSLNTWEPEDKSFSKHVLTDGQGDVTPNEGSVCCVHIAPVADECSIPEEVLGQYKLREDVEITIGEGDSFFSELFDKVVMSMKEGERCYIKTRVDSAGNPVDNMDISNSKLKLNFVLKSFSRAADISELEPDEKLERAERHKEKGTEIYQANNLEFSLKRFKLALSYLDSIDCKGRSTSDSISKRTKTLTCQCHLNLAAGYLKMENFQAVVDHCNIALDLDPDNVKGLFRRGQAYTKLNMYSEAKQDIEKALKLDGGNKAVASQLRTIEGKMKEERKMYQKMFS